MTTIFYYSNFCSNCRNIIPEITKLRLDSNTHFICIDNRIVKSDKNVYIILSNQKEILLPNTINKVPALMLLNRGSQVIFGQEILSYLRKIKSNISLNESNDDPENFNLREINNFGVMSDNFSFLDQSIEALTAKGDGGLRQLRSNVKLDHNDFIETPPDNYTPNKIQQSSIEKLETEREKTLNF